MQRANIKILSRKNDWESNIVKAIYNLQKDEEGDRDKKKEKENEKERENATKEWNRHNKTHNYLTREREKRPWICTLTL